MRDNPEVEVSMPHQGGKQRCFLQRVVPKRRIRCESTSRRTLSAVLHKERGLVRKTLSIISKSCLNDGATTITKVNDRHFPISFPTLGNAPVGFRTDPANNRPRYLLT